MESAVRLRQLSDNSDSSLAIGDVAEFDEHRCTSGARRTRTRPISAAFCAGASPISCRDQSMRKLYGQALGLALGEIEQNAGNIVRLGF